ETLQNAGPDATQANETATAETAGGEIGGGVTAETGGAADQARLGLNATATASTGETGAGAMAEATGQTGAGVTAEATGQTGAGGIGAEVDGRAETPPGPGRDSNAAAQPAAGAGAGGGVGGGPARLDRLGTISGEAARMLACDCGVVRVITAGASQPLDVGRETRVVSAAQRRALAVRDGGCVGCAAPVGWCEAHHIVHWLDFGPTDLDNLVLVCWGCHRDIHDRGWKPVCGPDGHWTLHPPDPPDPPHQAAPPRAARARRTSPGDGRPNPQTRRGALRPPDGQAPTRQDRPRPTKQQQQQASRAPAQDQRSLLTPAVDDASPPRHGGREAE
ncbi:MAG: DUF222 domain-containing protein, partial [Nitriliruptorales bacterium]|nr:DUF222 domain-containing protein [Nitriliruptorales bacterium]